MDIRWSYGVTTVPSRRDTLLPRTLRSLAAAGWPEPRLFVDGCGPQEWFAGLAGFPLERYAHTFREPKVRTAGNWWLALVELYVRAPEAHRYAVFQDDLVGCRNLRAYLDACLYPADGYWNLLTFPSNHGPSAHGGRAPSVFGEPERLGWAQGRSMSAGPNGPQNGRGAVALVFDRRAVVELLSSRKWVERAQDPHRGHKSVDGGVVTGLNAAGVREYVHNPTLVFHTGEVSSMGNQRHPDAPGWRGEDWDVLEWARGEGLVE
jgi:hypothetical protein